MLDLVPARKYIAGKTILLGVVGRNASRQVVCVGGVDRAFGHQMVALADVEVYVATITPNLRFTGVHAEGAANGIAAKQKVLGTAQDFGAFNVI